MLSHRDDEDRWGNRSFASLFPEWLLAKDACIEPLAVARLADFVGYHIVDHFGEDIVLAEHPEKGIAHPGSNNDESLATYSQFTIKVEDQQT